MGLDGRTWRIAGGDEQLEWVRDEATGGWVSQPKDKTCKKLNVYKELIKIYMQAEQFGLPGTGNTTRDELIERAHTLLLEFYEACQHPAEHKFAYDLVREIPHVIDEQIARLALNNMDTDVRDEDTDEQLEWVRDEDTGGWVSRPKDESAKTCEDVGAYKELNKIYMQAKLFGLRGTGNTTRDKLIKRAEAVLHEFNKACRYPAERDVAYNLVQEIPRVIDEQIARLARKNMLIGRLRGGHGGTVHGRVNGPRKSVAKKSGRNKTNGAPRKKTKKRKRVVGPNNCCICDDPLPAFGPGSVHEPLIPRACYMTQGRSNAHRICRECWFHGKHGRPAFASEDAVHGCPGCIAGKPFPPMLPAVGPPTAAFDLS